MQVYCEKCHRTMDESNFYTSNNLEKYPNAGKLNLCKKCLTMHVDNFNPETFLWILKELDLPYIEAEWKKLLDTYGKDPSKMTGTTILGRYISKMKLRQWKDCKWKDTERLWAESKEEIRKAMIQQGYAEEQINEELSKSMVNAMNVTSDQTSAQEKTEEKKEISEREKTIEEELTSENKKYLLLKWGASYTPEEWVQLEQLYMSVIQAFDIHTPTHIDYLKLICKTSLKCNQLIDCGDVEGFQKMSRVYDNLMKSAKFTAAQDKAENGEFVDSVGELVALAEQNGSIEKYYITTPQDKVDETLDDMKKYLYKLVTEEQGLGNLIESAIKQLQRQESNNADDDSDYEEEDIQEVLSDLDFENFSDFLENEKEKDLEKHGS